MTLNKNPAWWATQILLIFFIAQFAIKTYKLQDITEKHDKAAKQLLIFDSYGVKIERDRVYATIHNNTHNRDETICIGLQTTIGNKEEVAIDFGHVGNDNSTGHYPLPFGFLQASP